jgi:Ca-activated chloride channel family protein
VQGLQAQALITQRFKNQTDGWVNATYVYPLAEDSAVSQLTMRVGERVITGEIQEKNQARKTYAAAQAAGKKAALIEQQRPNLFRQHIANIAPGETVQIELGYSQQVLYRDGEFRLRLPLTLTPRYIPGVVAGELNPKQTLTPGVNGWASATHQVPDAPAITPTQRHAAAGEVVNPVSLSLQLDAGMPLAGVHSATHRLSIEQPTPKDIGQRLIHFAQGEVSMDRDFELTWQPQAHHEPLAAQFVSQWQGERYLQLMLMPPREVNANQVAPRELILVVDASGSMAGESIKQARASARLALDTLAPRDRFNLVVFATDTRAVFNQAVAATPGNLNIARRALAGIHADGGTNMQQALTRAFAHEPSAEHLQQVVFVTDGSVGNEAALLQQIQRHLGDKRLFTVAIGSAPNRFFMRRAAEFGRGSFTEIATAAHIKPRMAGLLNKLKSPVVTHITIDWPQPVQMLPRRVPDLYWGEPLLVTAKLAPWPSRLQPHITVYGTSAGKSWQRELPLKAVAATVEPDTRPIPALAQRFGREKIAFLQNELYANGKDSGASARQKIVPVALKYQLMSRYTSLVAVDQTPARPAAAAAHKRAVSNAMPAGSAMQAVGYPQTAAGVSWHLLLGALALFALLALKLWEVRYARH